MHYNNKVNQLHPTTLCESKQEENGTLSRIYKFEISYKFVINCYKFETNVTNCYENHIKCSF